MQCVPSFMPALSYPHINIPLHKHFHHDCPHNCSTDAPELSDASRQFRKTFIAKKMWLKLAFFFIHKRELQTWCSDRLWIVRERWYKRLHFAPRTGFISWNVRQHGSFSLIWCPLELKWLNRDNPQIVLLASTSIFNQVWQLGSERLGRAFARLRLERHKH